MSWLKEVRGGQSQSKSCFTVFVSIVSSVMKPQSSTGLIHAEHRVSVKKTEADWTSTCFSETCHKGVQCCLTLWLVGSSCNQDQAAGIQVCSHRNMFKLIMVKKHTVFQWSQRGCRIITLRSTHIHFTFNNMILLHRLHTRRRKHMSPPHHMEFNRDPSLLPFPLHAPAHQTLTFITIII